MLNMSLKQSIKEWDLLMPIIVNQDNVVLDGYHRLKACKELGIPITYSTTVKVSLCSRCNMPTFNSYYTDY